MASKPPSRTPSQTQSRAASQAPSKTTSQMPSKAPSKASTKAPSQTQSKVASQAPSQAVVSHAPSKSTTRMAPSKSKTVTIVEPAKSTTSKMTTASAAASASAPFREVEKTPAGATVLKYTGSQVAPDHYVSAHEARKAAMKSKSQTKSSPSKALTVITTTPSRYNQDDEYLRQARQESMVEKRKKLFMRPKTVVAKPICGLGKKPNERVDDTAILSPTDKLSIRRKTALDCIKDTIPKPDEAVPPTALPSWFDLDMSSKIPMIQSPDKYVYFSCGRLATPLHRCSNYYSTEDKLNRERVVNVPYNALHDPNARSYLFRPSVKSFLRRQGFINERNEVYCTMRDFNRFRCYLSKHFNDEINNILDQNSAFQRHQRDQAQLIVRYLNESEDNAVNVRKARAKTYMMESKQNRERKYDTKKRQMDLQLAKWKETKAKENLRRVMMGYEREKRAAERLYRVKIERLMMQREFLKQATMNDIEVHERKAANDLISSSTKEQNQINWINKKYEFEKCQVMLNKRREEALRQETQRNAVKRQRRVEAMRASLPAQIEKKKEAERLLWAIVRKYAMRWLEKVRKRLNAPKDVLHESVWIGKSKGVMDDTLKHLRDISGYEKMDDFVFNIIKFKNQIQRQIELEEAEEAAKAAEEEEEAAAAAAQAGGSKMTTNASNASSRATTVPGTSSNAIAPGTSSKATVPGTSSKATAPGTEASPSAPPSAVPSKMASVPGSSVPSNTAQGQATTAPSAVSSEIEEE